jgi:hypothetical protein
MLSVGTALEGEAVPAELRGVHELRDDRMGVRVEDVEAATALVRLE